MKVRTQLLLWYSAIILIGLSLITGWTYYELAIEHPTMAKALAAEGHSAHEEFGEILIYGGLPALVVALAGGWLFMRQALRPITNLTRTVESIRADSLGQRLQRSGNGDELDRLAEVFNSMTSRLESAFTRVREFTLSASHELKTPLTVMRGEIETRLREQHLRSSEREFLASQLDEIERLTKIVDALTFLAKADAGQLTLARVPVHFDELVRDSFADAQLLAQPARVQVELLSCEPVTIRGDRSRLKQLLLNLTDNAIKYNHAKGRITMQLCRNNAHAEFSIANTGPGITAEKLPRVFDRFYRGDTSHNAKVEGCGLGLSIVRGIAKAHQGEVCVESIPTEWTRVTVKLPILQEE